MFSNPVGLDLVAKRLEDYFGKTRTSRATLRGGAIVVVSKDTATFDFLQFLVKEVDLRIAVVHLDQVTTALRAIENMGSEAVKAIVIDRDLRNDRVEDGQTFLGHISSEYPNVPVFVDRCEAEAAKDVRQVSSRIGILKRGIPRWAYVKALGLPQTCFAHISTPGHF